MAKLNKTQIKAILDKLEREYEAQDRPEGLTEEQVTKANSKSLATTINKSNLPAPLKKWLTNDHWMLEDLIEDATVAQKRSMGLPHITPDYLSLDKRRDTFRAKLQDLEFELTMAGTDDYEDYMVAFRKAAFK